MDSNHRRTNSMDSNYRRNVSRDAAGLLAAGSANRCLHLQAARHMPEMAVRQPQADQICQRR